MKRFLVFFVLMLLVVWAVRSHHPRPPRHAPPAREYWYEPRHPREVGLGHELASEAREALDEVRHAYREARDEVRHAWREVSDEAREAYREALAKDHGRRLPPPPPPPPAMVPAREEADGLPVPIVPGTRVTEAEALPPLPARHVVPVRHARALQADTTLATIEGQISATEERARADAGLALRQKVVEWLGPDVPASWTPPVSMIQALVVETRTRPVAKDYGTLYIASLKVDFSPEGREEMVEAYNRQLIGRRLATLGGVLAFVLICLASISGYIRADEATRGYYTNRLRMLAAAGVGAAGAIVYRMVA